jgi:hypothetical protein
MLVAESRHLCRLYPSRVEGGRCLIHFVNHAPKNPDIIIPQFLHYDLAYATSSSLPVRAVPLGANMSVHNFFCPFCEQLRPYLFSLFGVSSQSGELFVLFAVSKFLYTSLHSGNVECHVFGLIDTRTRHD